MRRSNYFLLTAALAAGVALTAPDARAQEMHHPDGRKQRDHPDRQLKVRSRLAARAGALLMSAHDPSQAHRRHPLRPPHDRRASVSCGR